MSVYRTLATNLTDVDCLKKALGRVETRTGKPWNVQEHAQPVPLEGYEGKARKQTANLVIARAEVGPSSNDIGFLKGEDGTYQAIISDFDRHFHNDKWLDHLSQLYAEEKLVKTAKKAGTGFQVKSRKVVQGKIHLTFQQV